MPRAHILVLLCIFNSFILAQPPNELLFIPHANFSNNGSEIGISASYYTIDSNVTDQAFFLNHNFSKNIRYGIEFIKIPANETGQISNRFGSNFTVGMAHHLAVRFGELFSDSNYRTVFSAGMNYLSQQPLTFTNRIYYNESLSASWIPIDYPFNIHWAIARSRETPDLIFFSGLSFITNWGQFSIEWDNIYLNLSSHLNINDSIRLKAGITKNTLDESEIIFKSAISFYTNDEPTIIIKEVIPTKNNTPKTTNAAIGLTHIQEGLTHYYNGDFKRARKSYLLAKEFFPRSETVYQRLGSIYFKLGDFHDAYLSWKTANTIRPSKETEQFMLEAKSRHESQYL